jgi:carboxymethylenebutenolidase
MKRMTGQQIAVATRDGSRFDAYHAAPAAGRGPGVVIAQEIFGVNNALRASADGLAAKGFAVLVPDLFWRLEPGVDLGYGDADRQKAMALMGKFDAGQGVADIGAAVTALRAHPSCNGKVAVVGFCLGGTLAYLAAARLGVDAAVSYYGTAIHQHLGEAASIRCPLLLHFAGNDAFVPPQAVAGIGEAFAGHDDVEMHVYPGVNHAFANIDRAGIYDREAATLAHERTEALLRRLA